MNSTKPVDWRHRRLGTGKYGVSLRLPDGRSNPEYRRRLYAANQETERAKRRARYRATHPNIKERPGKYGVPATLPDGRWNPEWTRRWRADHPGYSTKYVNRWMLAHPERWQAKVQRFHESHPGYNRRWRESHPGYDRRWEAANPARARAKHARHAARRRGMGLHSPSRILGTPFPKSHLHHLTVGTAVYIPASLHRSVYHNLRTGYNMDRINTAAMEFYERAGP